MRTIRITGTGRATARPDLIEISMGLTALKADYEDAMGMAAKQIEDIRTALAEVGFEREDIKTTSFNVDTEYNTVRKRERGNRDGEYEDKYERVFVGYKVQNSLKLRFDMDTKRLASALSAIAQSAVMPEFDINFTVKDSEAVKSEILRDAARVARQRAEILCTASGAKLGALLSVDYSWAETRIYSETHVDYSLPEGVLAAPSAIDIEPEDINASDSVTFEWEIE